MAAPRLFKYNDPNAPVLSGTRGSLINLLKKCLIDGYGTNTAPGGWTVAFQSALQQTAVFRNDTLSGTGFFLKVNEETSVAANIPSVAGFEVMTDINNGAGAFPAAPFTTYTSAWANTTAIPWLLVADNKAFYFVCWPGVSAGTNMTKVYAGSGFFFGDFITAHDSDAYNCILCLNMSYVNTTNTTNAGFVTPTTPGSATTYSASMAGARKKSGLPGYFWSQSIFGGGPSNTAADNPTYAMGGYGAGGLVYSINAPLYMARPYVSDGEQYTCRGWLPGLYYPNHQQPFDPFVIISDNGKSYITAAGINPNTYYGNYYWEFFISLDDWRV